MDEEYLPDNSLIESIESLGFAEILDRKYTKEITENGKECFLLLLLLEETTIISTAKSYNELKLFLFNQDWPLNANSIMLRHNKRDKIIKRRYQSLIKGISDNYFNILKVGFSANLTHYGSSKNKFVNIAFWDYKHYETETIYTINELDVSSLRGEPVLSSLHGFIYRDKPAMKNDDNDRPKLF